MLDMVSVFTDLNPIFVNPTEGPYLFFGIPHEILYVTPRERQSFEGRLAGPPIILI
jgi:hypothetical protein